MAGGPVTGHEASEKFDNGSSMCDDDDDDDDDGGRERATEICHRSGGTILETDATIHESRRMIRSDQSFRRRSVAPSASLG